MEADQVQTRPRHQGGETLLEVHRHHLEMGCAVARPASLSWGVLGSNASSPAPSQLSWSSAKAGRASRERSPTRQRVAACTLKPLISAQSRLPDLQVAVGTRVGIPIQGIPIQTTIPVLPGSGRVAVPLTAVGRDWLSGSYLS